MLFKSLYLQFWGEKRKNVLIEKATTYLFQWDQKRCSDLSTSREGTFDEVKTLFRFHNASLFCLIIKSSPWMQWSHTAQPQTGDIATFCPGAQPGLWSMSSRSSNLTQAFICDTNCVNETERKMDLLLIRRHEAVAGEDAFSNLRIVNLKIKVTFYSVCAD